jgi:hypothetical protein
MTRNDEQPSFEVIEAFYHPVLGLVVVDWDRDVDEVMMTNCPKVASEDEAKRIVEELIDDTDKTIGTMGWLE